MKFRHLVKRTVAMILFCCGFLLCSSCAKTFPLIRAATLGDLPEVKRLAAKGAEVNAKDYYGDTALIQASYNGHVEVVQALLSKGAEVNGKTNDGDTALMWASSSSHVEVVQALLSKGAEVNGKNNDGDTALMWASPSSHVEVVQALLSKGAEVNGKSDDGDTALMRASSSGHVEVVQALLSKGAEVNAKNIEGNTALMRASSNGHVEVVQALLSKDAEVNAKNHYNDTALMFASSNGHVEVVQALLSKGAEVNAINNDGNTAVMFATFNSHLEVLKLLESFNMPPLLRDASDLVASDPNNVGYWIEYGRACLLSNNPHGAEMAFLRAIQLDPKCQLAYRHLGLILMRLQRYEDAEKVYKKALEVNPVESGATWTAYGYCLVGLRRDEEALSAFRESCKLNTDVPSVISAKLGISGLLLRRGDTEGAEREYKDAIKLDPEIVKILEKQRELSTGASKDPYNNF
jgi:ankyrin repeat protein